MIKSFVVTTDEIDDAEAAAKEIADKISALALCANSVGIVVAHPEVVASGIYKKACETLPFPTVGFTSIAHCANGEINIYFMSILILTSDDCKFACELSGEENENTDVAASVNKIMNSATASLADEPKLALLYAPFVSTLRYGDYLDAISNMKNGLPIFGAVASDANAPDDPAHKPRTLFCGEAYRNRFALTLACGNISPKFYLASVTDEAVVMPDIGVITELDKNVIKKINNISAVAFLKDVGFLSDAELNSGNKGVLSSVFVQRVDGQIISRIPVLLLEDRVVCGGQMVEGATLSIAFNTKDSVLESARSLVQKILREHKSGTVILHSCLGRRFGLLGDALKELDLIADGFGADFCYTAQYVNGEFCPVQNRNFDHNQTLAACVL